MLREEDIAIQLRCQQFICKSYMRDLDGEQSVLLFEQRKVDVLAVNHLIAHGDRDVLAVHYDLLRILCIFFYIHENTPFSLLQGNITPIEFNCKAFFSTQTKRVLIMLKNVERI